MIMHPKGLFHAIPIRRMRCDSSRILVEIYNASIITKLPVKIENQWGGCYKSVKPSDLSYIHLLCCEWKLYFSLSSI